MTIIQTVAGGAGGSGGEAVDLSDPIVTITGSSFSSSRYAVCNYSGKGTYYAGGYDITSYVANGVYISSSTSGTRIGIISNKTAICNALKTKMPNLEDGEYWITFLSMGIFFSTSSLNGHKLKLTVTGGNFDLSQIGGTDTLWIIGNSVSLAGLVPITL